MGGLYYLFLIKLRANHFVKPAKHWRYAYKSNRHFLYYIRLKFTQSPGEHILKCIDSI